MTSTKSKLDPERLAHLKRIADERLAVSRQVFEDYRSVAEALQAQRRVIEQCQHDAEQCFPSQRLFFESKTRAAQGEADRLTAEATAALARSEAATEASQVAGRLYQACRIYAVENGLIPDPQTGATRTLRVVA